MTVVIVVVFDVSDASGGDFMRYEVMTGVERRRRWSDEEKLSILGAVALMVRPSPVSRVGTILRSKPSPYDPGMMFQIMVLQALYGLSDDQAEFQIQGRLSFMRFLGLGLGDKVPDAKTIWLFREHLTQAGAVNTLFARFDRHLERAGGLELPRLWRWNLIHSAH